METMGSRVKCYSYIYRQTHTPCTLCSNLQLELDSMKTKYEKAEKERNDYKMQVDKLENRVSSFCFMPQNLMIMCILF